MPEIIIGADFPRKVIPLINDAKQSIKIIIFDWRLYPQSPAHPVSQFVLSLQSAVKRGVKVSVLLSNVAVKKQLEGFGFECKNLFSSKLIHAKMMLIDDVQAIIGSHNYTQNAFQNNLEVSVSATLQDKENELKKFFDCLWPL